jgi:tetratricopeptide (TPR) repeat protein
MTFRSGFICALLLMAFFSINAAAQVRKPAPAPLRSINVVTEPDAIVWIDGVQYGKTDKLGNLTITTVAAGVHTLRVRANGFKEISQPLAATQKGDIEVTLVKTTDEAELAYQKAEVLATSDRDAAAEAYRSAVKLRPKYPEAYLGLARVLAELGDHEEALRAIAGARKARLGYAEASAVEGRIFREAGEEAKAIASFKRAISEGKGFQPEAYTGLGLYFKEKGESAGGDFDAETANYIESAKYLKVALKQLSGAPDTIVIYQLLGLVYERMKKYQDAIAVYEEFLRIFPNSGEASAVQSFIVQLRKQMAEQ